MRLRFAFLFVLSCLASAQQGPANPDFEQGAPGQVPTGWFVPTSDYSAQRRSDRCATGSGCAVLMPRVPAPTQPFGNLMQSFAAASFRGKTIRLRAAIRMDKAEPSDHAQMWLRVDRTGRQMGLFDNMGDRPITSSEWRTYEISGEVDADAQSINIGVMLIGKGTVWIDAVSFSTVDASSPSPEETAAREQIAAQYARLSAAYASGKFDQVSALALPDAQVGNAMVKQPLSAVITQLQQEYGQGVRYTSHPEIKSLRMQDNEATVSVQDQMTRTAADGRQEYLATSRDVWTKTPPGWKLKESVQLTLRPVIAKPDPETLKPVIAELRERARPLRTVEAGNSFDDLAAFGKAVGDARVVALGEASHGTREFFQMKHRLLEYLVKEKGFTVFAIEANWPEALAVDRYIKSGEGDASSAIAKMYFWTWNTEEVRDLVEWMRRFNQAPGPHPALTFTSFDMQTAPVAAQQALDYLKTVTPDEAARIEPLYGQLKSLTPGMPEQQVSTLAEQTAAVVKYLDAHRTEMERASSHAAWRDARQAASIANQACELRRPGKAGTYRDEMMAANVEWLLSEVHPNEKVVLWAHNYHVRGGADGANKGMGAYLREKLGDRMYVLGFAFRRGQVRAIGMAGGNRGAGLANHDVPPAPEGSGSAVLGAAGLPLFYLDLKSLPASSPLQRWLSESHLYYDFGAVWYTSDSEANLQAEALARFYDGLVFVDEGHAARGLPMRWN